MMWMKRVRFWVGVALLVFSAIIWLAFVDLTIENPQDAGWNILTAALITVIPIILGINCVKRSKEAKAQLSDIDGISEPGTRTALEIQRPNSLIQDSGSEVEKKMPLWFRVVAWVELLCGILLLSVGLAGLPVGEMQDPGDMWFMVGFGVFFVLLGIWMVGMTTKVVFNKPYGHITITRGYVPIFLVSKRKKRISREEAKSVFVRSRERWVSTGPTASGGYATFYETKVITSSGKELKLYGGGTNRGVADYLAKRILDFAQDVDVEMPRQKLNDTRQVKSRSGAKFSMRVEEAFQATFASGVLGMVIGGTLEQGTIRSGDWVEIRGYLGTKRAKVFEVDTLTGSGVVGEKVRLLIEGVTDNDVMLGDILERL